MKENHFYAMLARMKYIERWGLMYNSRPENLSEHTLEVAFLTHALITLHNRRFGGELDPGTGVLYALYHDCSEIITGDLPTPVKYYNPQIKEAYKRVEQVASRRLLDMLPQDLRQDYDAYLDPGEEAGRYLPYVKAADRLSALIKCLEEHKQGNREFDRARETTRQALLDMKLPEVEVFMEESLPSYELTLDELK